MGDGRHWQSKIQWPGMFIALRWTRFKIKLKMVIQHSSCIHSIAVAVASFWAGTPRWICQKKSPAFASTAVVSVVTGSFLLEPKKIEAFLSMQSSSVANADKNQAHLACCGMFGSFRHSSL